MRVLFLFLNLCLFPKAEGQNEKFDIYRFYRILASKEKFQFGGANFICDSVTSNYQEFTSNYWKLNTVDLSKGKQVALNVDSVLEILNINLKKTNIYTFEQMPPYDTSIHFTNEEIKCAAKLSELEAKWLSGKLKATKYQAMIKPIYSSSVFKSYNRKNSSIKKALLFLFRPLKFEDKVLIIYKWYRGAEYMDSEAIRYMLFSLNGKCIDKR